MTPARLSTYPTNSPWARGGFISGVIMLLCAVFALSVGAGSAKAGADPIARGLAAAALSPARSTIFAAPGITNYASIANGGNNYANWRKCRENARTATAKCAILFIGDSTTVGFTLTSPVALKTWAMRLATGLTGQPLSVPATQAAFFGEGKVGSSSTPVNAAITYGSGWSAGIVANALGGSWPTNTTTTASGTTNALAIAFTQTVDTCDIWYPVGPGGSFTYQVDGGAASGSISETGTSTLTKQTVSLGSAGTHTLYINRVSGGVFIAGVSCYNSAAPAVSIWNGAVSAANTSAFVDSSFGYNALPAIGILQPALTIIDLGINDWGGASGGAPQISVAQFTTNMQTLITAAKAVGDVALVVPPASNPAAAGGGTSTAVQAQYVAAIYALAQSNKLAVFDMQQRWGNFTQFSAAGLNSDAVVHPNALGHMDMGAWVASILAGI